MNPLRWCGPVNVFQHSEKDDGLVTSFYIKSTFKFQMETNDSTFTYPADCTCNNLFPVLTCYILDATHSVDISLALS